MHLSRFARGATAVVLALTLAACDDDPVEVQEPNLVEVAQQAGGFTTLLTALDVAGLTATLQGDGPFTVLAPTDAAFEALPAGALDALLADVDLLTRVLTYHVIDGDVPSSQVLGLTSATTLNGKAVAISVVDGNVMLDDAMVVTPDVAATNGVIHIIDEVLLPEVVLDLIQTAQKAGAFSTLLAALEATSLTSVLQGDGPFTVFAPTDAAFAELPAGTLEALLADPDQLAAILTYHVVAGAVTSAQVVNLTEASTVNGADISISVDGFGDVQANNANVVDVDIEATNGIIHVIDQVLLPPQ